LLVLLVSLAGAGLSALEHWYLIPKREAERERLADVREGRRYSPEVELMTYGDDCVLTNVDSRSIEEAHLRWRIYIVQLARETFVGIEGAGAIKHELSPRDSLSAKFPGKRMVICNPGDASCPLDNCVMVGECTATYHRKSDMRQYSSSTLVVVRPPHCDVQAVRLSEPPPADPVIAKALALFPSFRAKWTEQRPWWRHGGEEEQPPDPSVIPAP
jgi:hypothetical protein